jgi:hypothetical protein
MRFRLADRSEPFDDARAASLRALESRAGLRRGSRRARPGARQRRAGTGSRGGLRACDQRSTSGCSTRTTYYARFLVTQGDHAEPSATTRLHSQYIRTTTSRSRWRSRSNRRSADRAGEQRAIERSWAAIERRLAIDPDDLSRLRSRLRRAGNARAEWTSRAASASGPWRCARTIRRLTYNAACTAALSGEPEAALDLLERAIALGWSNAQWLMNDDDLVPLHDHPRFKQILAALA